MICVSKTGPLLLVSCLLIPGEQSWAEMPNAVTQLDIKVDHGLATVKALVDLPGTPEVALAVLTDYANWPTLFPHQPRINAVRSEKGIVVTDMSIPRCFSPGEYRLITETRQTQPGRLETTLLDGDFVRYVRIWEVTPTQEGAHTRARLMLEVQPKAWTPDWLLSLALKWELEEHFEKLRDRVLLKSRK